MLHSKAIENPGKLIVPKKLDRALKFFVLIGIIVFALGLKLDAKRLWVSFLHNHFYFMSLALGGLFFTAIQWITGAIWSVPIRRLSEAMTAYLPFVLISFGILYFGLHHLYLWLDHAQVHADEMLVRKEGYLNLPFFLIRNAIGLFAFLFFSRKMVGNSLLQDQAKGLSWTEKNRALCPPFLILFGLGFTMMSFDLLMSLDPKWFSTMFGVYTFSGLFYSSLALICLMALWLQSQGKLQGFIHQKHFHTLGQLMFGFTVFWAYIGFSQFMLIWYANLPEETGYFLRRIHSNWVWISVFLMIGKFGVPFFFLLSRYAKMNLKNLTFVSVFMLVAQWFDLLWVIQPEFFKDGPELGWMEAGITIGFLGIFGLLVARFLSKNPIVAIGDPLLEESLSSSH